MTGQTNTETDMLSAAGEGETVSHSHQAKK